MTSRPLWSLVALVVAAIGLALTPTPATARSVVAIHGHLRVVGNHVVDRRGRPVVLRGMSLFWSQWMPQYYDRATIDTLVDDWKVDVVRAAIAVDNHSGRPVDGVLEHYPTERARAFRVIDAAIARGIYVVVDWHAHSPHPAQAIRFFTDVARRYRGRPNLLYETWNEPYAGYTWAREIRPYHLQVIPAIRAIDPRALVIAGTPTFSQDVDIAAKDPLPFANVAYTLHYYADQPHHQQPLMDKARSAAATIALFVTEQGFVDADGDGPINAQWSQKWWDFLNAAKISHLNWSLSDKREGASALRPGASPIGGFDAAERTPSGEKVYRYLRHWHHGAS